MGRTSGSQQGAGPNAFWGASLRIGNGALYAAMPSTRSRSELKDSGHDHGGPMAGLNTNRYSRREVMRAALGTTLFAAGGSVLSGCGGSSSQSATPASNTAHPKHGGTLHAGVPVGAPLTHSIPTRSSAILTFCGMSSSSSSLVTFDKHAQPQLTLAEEFTPNANATQWTVRLRRGITFHNGKTVTADDIIYTLQRITNPKAPLSGAASMASVDTKNIKKLDQYTVQIPCHTPFAALYELQACYYYSIVPVGFNPKQPVGTGPYAYESFTPGQASTFVRNANYWQAPLPYTDRVVITDFEDETSQVNALTSGAVNLVDSLSGVSIASSPERWRARPRHRRWSMDTIHNADGRRPFL